MSLSFKISNIAQVSLFLKGKQVAINGDVRKGLRRAAIFIQGEVKESIAGRRAEPTSVDKGRFLNSIEFESDADNAVVFTQLPYPKFLEEGTSRIGARHHFRNSKDRNKGKITKIIAQSINV